ncbi:MAG: corrinoid protein [Terrisporobacter othiniensis]|uniref:corrinoid protein n=1 Tax=Terrisporobacter othiniensis TaxID=1577792 RepID=UPI002A759E42|nr:corrinoid protein [Terrisporobacter othiniensis]MDY3372996.1 corrinoid protein [Terrisporobacter othiniensis]
MKNYIEDIKQLVIDGEDEEIVEAIQEAIDDNVAVSDIVNNSLIEAMNVIGPMMASGELFVPEVLMSAETMQIGLNYLKPMLKEGDITSLGTIVIGTVEGDLHDIGKNLVAMMLESSGFEVINIGIDQPAQAFVDAVIKHNAQIVGLSALLTTTMSAMRETVKLIREKGLDVRVAIGGAPVSQEFADEIGADGYSEDATGSVLLCKKMLGIEVTA